MNSVLANGWAWLERVLLTPKDVPSGAAARFYAGAETEDRGTVRTGCEGCGCGGCDVA